MIDELQLNVSIEELAVEIENTVKVQEEQSSRPALPNLITRINSQEQSSQPSPTQVPSPQTAVPSQPPPPPPIQPPSPSMNFQSASVSPMFFNKSISDDETSFKKIPSNPNLVGLNSGLSSLPSVILPSTSSLLTMESMARNSPVALAPSPSKQQQTAISSTPVTVPFPTNHFPLVKTASKVEDENEVPLRARANSNVSIEENISRKDESSSSKLHSGTSTGNLFSS